MPAEIHPATREPEALLNECEVRRTRRSGPGGQHRNKVETAIVLCHRPTGVCASATERRSQSENLRVALRRLRENLAIEVRCPVAAEAPPSERWQSRCRGGRISVSRHHDDFAALLAEALDRIVADRGDAALAASRLGCTTSQLVKLLGAEPRALALVNSHRGERGLKPLKS